MQGCPWNQSEEVPHAGWDFNEKKSRLETKNDGVTMTLMGRDVHGVMNQEQLHQKILYGTKHENAMLHSS